MSYTNDFLNRAKLAKQDEFYTLRQDIEEELVHYKDHFKGKVVYCNADDPHTSQFTQYFRQNFHELGLRKLISSCYVDQQTNLFAEPDFIPPRAYMATFEGIGKEHVQYLYGDGDFRSRECLELLAEADICCTNPPFSLFREYFHLLIKHQKKFLLVASMMVPTYKKVFPYFHRREVQFGITHRGGGWDFAIPNNYPANSVNEKKDEFGNRLIEFGNVRWCTNLDHGYVPEPVPLTREYLPDSYEEADKFDLTEYEYYDNYDAIDVRTFRDIPKDYEGEMGVPVSFLDHWNPDQFELINMDKIILDERNDPAQSFYVNGKLRFVRFVIKHRKHELCANT